MLFRVEPGLVFLFMGLDVLVSCRYGLLIKILGGERRMSPWKFYLVALFSMSLKLEIR